MFSFDFHAIGSHRVRAVSASRKQNQPMTSADVTLPKPTARSRVSNGSALLPGVDGRSVWMRRFRDLMQLHVADAGGDVSEAKRSIIRRASTLEVELERLEAKFAASGEADAADLDLYQRASNTMRRHLESVGLERVARNVTPALEAYVAETYGGKGGQ